MTSLAIDAKQAIEDAIATLAPCADVRVLRRFTPRTRYCYPAPERIFIGLYVDCETTGLDVERDEIVEFAAQRFEFSSFGNIYAIGESYSSFEEPTVPISSTITELTGISQEDVAGQRIRDEAVAAVADGVHLVIAHHADFDRKMIERRFPALFGMRPWGCSHVDIPWHTFGAACSKLSHLLMDVCREFHGGHRALDDVQAGIHLLAASGFVRTPMSYLLETARLGVDRIYANASPFGAKDTLKARGYYWDAAKKVWYRDLPGDGVSASEELRWCRAEAGASPTHRHIHPRDRFSVRG